MSKKGWKGGREGGREGSQGRELVGTARGIALPSSLGQRSKHRIVAADGRSVLLVLGTCVAGRVEFRLEGESFKYPMIPRSEMEWRESG